MEKLFLSPAKAPLYNLETFGHLLGGSLELDEKQLRPFQSLAAKYSQSAEQSLPLPPTKHTWAQGSELPGRCWAGEAQGRVV